MLTYFKEIDKKMSDIFNRVEQEKNDIFEPKLHDIITNHIATITAAMKDADEDYEHDVPTEVDDVGGGADTAGDQHDDDILDIFSHRLFLPSKKVSELSGGSNKCTDFLGNVFRAGERYFPFRSRPCYECKCSPAQPVVIDGRLCRETSCSEHCEPPPTTRPTSSPSATTFPPVKPAARKALLATVLVGRRETHPPQNACCAVTCAYMLGRTGARRNRPSGSRIDKVRDHRRQKLHYDDKRPNLNRRHNTTKLGSDVHNAASGSKKVDTHILDPNNMTSYKDVILPVAPDDADFTAWLLRQQQQQHAAYIGNSDPAQQQQNANNIPMPDGRFGSPLYRFQGRAPTMLEQLPAIGSGLVVAVFILAGLCVLSLLNSSATLHGGGGSGGRDDDSEMVLHSGSTAAARRRRARRHYEQQQRNRNLGDEEDFYDYYMRLWGWQSSPPLPRQSRARHNRDLLVSQSEQNNTVISSATSPATTSGGRHMPWFTNGIYRSPRRAGHRRLSSSACSSSESAQLMWQHQASPPPSYWLAMKQKQQHKNNAHTTASSKVCGSEEIVPIHRGLNDSGVAHSSSSRLQEDAVSVSTSRAESPPPAYDDVLAGAAAQQQ